MLAYVVHLLTVAAIVGIAICLFFKFHGPVE